MSVFGLQEDAAPFLKLHGSSGPLRWDEGVLLAYRLRTTALQVSASTLQLYADDPLRFGPAWRSFDCAAATSALCVSDTGVALMGVGVDVTTPRDVAALLPRSALLREFDGAVCSSDSTGRSSGAGDVYTVSMCDLVEGSLRFVVEDGRVLWIRDRTGVSETLVLCGIALYAASTLAQHLSALMAAPELAVGPPAPAPSAETRLRACALNVLLCFVSVAVLVGMCETHLEYLVSEHDVALYRVLLVYVGAEVALLCLKETGPPDKVCNFGHQIGLSTAVLLIVTLRLHNTFDTPFLPVLVGVFGTRAACKLLQHMHDGLTRGTQPVNLVSALLDLGAWCALLAYSVVRSPAPQDHLAVATNVAVALLLGLGLSVCIAARRGT